MGSGLYAPLTNSFPGRDAVNGLYVVGEIPVKGGFHDLVSKFAQSIDQLACSRRQLIAAFYDIAGRYGDAFGHGLRKFHHGVCPGCYENPYQEQQLPSPPRNPFEGLSLFPVVENRTMVTDRHVFGWFCNLFPLDVFRVRVLFRPIRLLKGKRR